MRYYTGLDISMKETAVCTVDHDGKIVSEDTVKTDPKIIARCLKKNGLPIKSSSHLLSPGWNKLKRLEKTSENFTYIIGIG